MQFTLIVWKNFCLLQTELPTKSITLNDKTSNEVSSVSIQIPLKVSIFLLLFAVQHTRSSASRFPACFSPLAFSEIKNFRYLFKQLIVTHQTIPSVLFCLEFRHFNSIKKWSNNVGMKVNSPEYFQPQLFASHVFIWMDSRSASSDIPISKFKSNARSHRMSILYSFQ